MPKIVNGEIVKETNSNNSTGNENEISSTNYTNEFSYYAKTGLICLVAFLIFGFKGLLILLMVYGAYRLYTQPSSNSSLNSSSYLPGNNRSNRIHGMNDLPQTSSKSC